MTFQTFDRSDVVTWPDKKKPTNLYFSRIYVFRLPFHWIQCACKDLIICRGLRKDNKIHNHKAERVQVRRPTPPHLAPKFLLLNPTIAAITEAGAGVGPRPKIAKKLLCPKNYPLNFSVCVLGGGQAGWETIPTLPKEKKQIIGVQLLYIPHIIYLLNTKTVQIIGIKKCHSAYFFEH